VTSNTSKCVNNMFDDAHNVGWLEAIVRIVDIMSTRISHCRIKHADRQASEVVPHLEFVFVKERTISLVKSIERQSD
jgi:hypothetical protein